MIDRESQTGGHWMRIFRLILAFLTALVLTTASREVYKVAWGTGNFFTSTVTACGWN